MLSLMVELLMVGDGNPRSGGLIVILRVVVTIFGRGEREFGRWRRRIVNGEFEVRVAVGSAEGMQPEQTADTKAGRDGQARDERSQPSQVGLE